MITTRHFKQRMHQRKISPFMVDMLLKFGEFNENCQRLVICNQQKGALTELKNKLKKECERTSHYLKQLLAHGKNPSENLSKSNLILERREQKRNLKEMHKNLKDLERFSHKKYTLVLENGALITVFY